MAGERDVRRALAFGQRGEERVAALYRARGYAVLARNWRCAHGEIDLVCARGRTLVVCEVKTRRDTGHGHPLEAVTPAKQRRLRRLAAVFLCVERGRWDEVRFDVASVLGRDVELEVEVEVVEGAF